MPAKNQNDTRDKTWLEKAGVFVENMVMHNFYFGELIGELFNPVEFRESHWVYAYT